ncbi:MAG: binding-protein-dependent transport system inner rane component [Streptosporangiaceae bacterium]|jgi:alpha-glucoside transport system permease protein|nr:binding-protein-dependent transport system inner rane component [Streptosporangiaceae bacterium]
MAASTEQPAADAGSTPADDARSQPSPGSGRLGPPPLLSAGFLLPALVLLALLVVYPIVYTVWRSLHDADGSRFVGLGNYIDMFTESVTVHWSGAGAIAVVVVITVLTIAVVGAATLIGLMPRSTAGKILLLALPVADVAIYLVMALSSSMLTVIKNNVIWVVLAPTVITALGLVFAVLIERIRWATAFKLVVFMPMAISMVAAGVIFTLVYDQNPDRGVLNAVVVGVHDTFKESSPYPGAHPRDNGSLVAQGKAFATREKVRPGQAALLPVVAVPPERQKSLPPVRPADPKPGTITGTVWLDFAPGGGGKPNRPDAAEKGLPKTKVQALSGGKVVATAMSGKDGAFAFPRLPAGSYTLRLPESNFQAPYGGVNWLGPSLVTYSIIGAYIWMWAGFAMVLIAAGLAAIPRDALEAARVDGATEWQVFWRVTMPLLAPVLVVVLVTLVINVLKIFDLVYMIAPGATQQNANVLALDMYLKSFGGGNDQGMGSAVAVLLLVLVLPAMIFNIRRFRREQG